VQGACAGSLRKELIAQVRARADSRSRFEHAGDDDSNLRQECSLVKTFADTHVCVSRIVQTSEVGAYWRLRSQAASALG
jgi:CO dehydrogenase/acetyl-CoA synthase beta subunit